MTSENNSRLFKNNFLEQMTHTHIAVPISAFIVYASALLFICFKYTTLMLKSSIFLFFLGWLAFTWLEYLMHRYIFHLKINSKVKAKFQYMVHGIHHAHPKDKDRLAMPPLLSLTIASMLLIVFRILIGDFTFAFLPGMLVGYALYLLIHYLVHVYPPPKNILKYFWINHSIHHHRDNNLAFGVTTTLWDHIYGTHYNRLREKQ